MCVPNVCTWGHWQRGWSLWPGDEARMDVRFPAARGLERLTTPRGEAPVPLPKEEYGLPEVEEKGPGIQIQQGPSTGPIEAPQPFEYGPGLEGLPGLDMPPEGPPPEPAPAEGGKKESTSPPSLQQPPSPELPSADSIPPAPAPERSRVASADEQPLLGAAYPAPSPEWLERALAASVESGKSEPAAPFPWTNEAPRASLAASSQNERPPVDPAVKKAVASSEPPEAPQPKTVQQAQPAPTPAQTAAYEEPVGVAGSGATALDGYCPVELVRHEQWVQGKPQWAVTYRGQIFMMSGPAEHRLFRANPERYAPALSGCDPVLRASDVGRVAGRTQTCVIYEGRLFMFSCQATLDKFRQEPEQYVKNLTPPAK